MGLVASNVVWTGELEPQAGLVAGVRASVVVGVAWVKGVVCAAWVVPWIEPGSEGWGPSLITA